MKNIIILLAFISFITCKAQTPVFPIYSLDTNYGDTTNAYYKDVDNFRDPFVGTWVYINGSELLRVQFKKMDMYYNDNGAIPYYVDYLVGEIQYKNTNGVESFNSLNVLNNPTQLIYNYSMFSGPSISNKGFPQCLDCPTGTRRLLMFYTEPNIDDMALKGAWAMRVVVENGVTKLKVQFTMDSSSNGINKANFDLPSTDGKHDVPYGEYTLIKE